MTEESYARHSESDMDLVDDLKQTNGAPNDNNDINVSSRKPASSMLEYGKNFGTKIKDSSIRAFKSAKQQMAEEGPLKGTKWIIDEAENALRSPFKKGAKKLAKKGREAMDEMRDENGHIDFYKVAAEAEKKSELWAGVAEGGLRGVASASELISMRLKKKSK